MPIKKISVDVYVPFKDCIFNPEIDSKKIIIRNQNLKFTEVFGYKISDSSSEKIVDIPNDTVINDFNINFQNSKFELRNSTSKPSLMNRFTKRIVPPTGILCKVFYNPDWVKCKYIFSYDTDLNEDIKDIENPPYSVSERYDPYEQEPSNVTVNYKFELSEDPEEKVFRDLKLSIIPSGTTIIGNRTHKPLGKLTSDIKVDILNKVNSNIFEVTIKEFKKDQVFVPSHQGPMYDIEEYWGSVSPKDKIEYDSSIKDIIKIMKNGVKIFGVKRRNKSKKKKIKKKKNLII